MSHGYYGSRLGKCQYRLFLHLQASATFACVNHASRIYRYMAALACSCYFSKLRNSSCIDTIPMPKQTMTIRQATLADVDTIAPLFDRYRQFYRQAPDLLLARAFIRERLALRESVIFLAENEDNEVIGFTQLYPSFSSVSASRIWVLNDLFVVEAARGQGAGKALLDAAKAHAKASGATRLDLSTAHDNPAQKLYEAQGYLRDSTFYYYSLQVA